MVMLMLLALYAPEDGRLLVLNNGHEVPLTDGFEVKDDQVFFKSVGGDLLQLPLAKVDLKATRTKEARRKALAGLPKAKRPDRDPHLSALVREVKAAGEMGGDNIIDNGEVTHSMETFATLANLSESFLITSDQAMYIYRDYLQGVLGRGGRRAAPRRYAGSQTYMGDSTTLDKGSQRGIRILDRRLTDLRRGKMFNGGIHKEIRDSYEEDIQSTKRARDAARRR